MSDEEHQFEGTETEPETRTFQEQASNIRKNSYIIIQNRPCKVVEVSASKTGNYGHGQCHFAAIDIFTGERFEDTVPSSHNCDVPHVKRVDYQLVDISEDGYDNLTGLGRYKRAMAWLGPSQVSLLTENGNTKDDLKLPTYETLAGQIKDGFNEGKDLMVSVMSAMGEQQICGIKDIGPK